MRMVLPMILGILMSPAFSQSPVCGQAAPCEIEGGDYHLITPQSWDGTSPLPALIWFHGHNSSAASVFRSAGLRREFVDQGYLVIAPNGEARPGSSVRAWPARPNLGSRDDVAFTLDVLDDVSARLPINADRVFVAGFSAGGSMAWMMGCYAGDRFAAVASVAGALRRPHPDGPCPAGPFKLIQIHGFTDAQVPFEGRAIRDWHQGDVFSSLGLLRGTNSCRSNPDEITLGEPFRCREWSASCEQAAVKLCIHDGGHGLPKGWTTEARRWFEGQ